MTVGLYLKRLRVEYKILQADIAREIGVSQQAYSKYEQRKVITHENADRIQDAIDKLKNAKQCKGILEPSTK